MRREKIRYGMVGGDLQAFIGDVHRKGAAMTEQTVLSAGCFSRDPEKNRACGVHYGIPEDRIYPDFETMAKEEGRRVDGIDFVSICTPNSTHFATAKAFLENGIHVYCEKPLTFTSQEAEALKRLAGERGLLFGMNYSHSGNVMVHEARQLVRSGKIGRILNINAEYLLEGNTKRLFSPDKEDRPRSWRGDPAVAGRTNCVGDIATHIEHTIRFITGFRIRRLAAALDTYGEALDLNANILVEYDNGCHGVYAASKVAAGHMNGLAFRIFGTEGALEWVQETPNTLLYTPVGQPTQILNRGTRYISAEAAAFSRLPSGHPEGIYEAFGNMYQAFTDALLKKVNGEALTEKDLDFPNVEDGLLGVRFIEACLKSSADGAAWTAV